jgi:4'-phosphopantetheinyl transferase
MSLIKIRNSFLNNVTWQAADSCDFEVDSVTHVWKIEIEANTHNLPQYHSLLNPLEIERSQRYRHIPDTNRFIVSRAVTRILPGKYLHTNPSEIVFRQGVNKKPFVENSGLFYNISHSGDLVLLAVSDASIGIDVERIDPGFDFNDILTDYFSASEQKLIITSSQADSFYRLWTRKEALTKATGKGLDDDLKLIPAPDGEHPLSGPIIGSNENWAVTSFQAAIGYMASLAANDQGKPTRFFEFGG